jgi:choline dehydrogenase-like flavoprotein
VLFNNLQNGRATGVEYKVYDDPRSSAATTHCVEADIVVLATHAIENAKLLLASGVDNKRIGQHLMDHPLVVTQALMPAGASIGPHRGPPATSFIDAFRDGQWRKEFASFRIGIFNWGWGFQAESFSSEVKALVDRGSLNPDRPGKPVIGRELRRQLTEHLPRQFQLELMLEQTADPGNRVTIDRNYRDHLGNFRPVIEYGVDPYVTTGAQKAVEVSQKILSRLGATEYNYTKAQPPRHKGDEAVITTVKVGKYYYDILGARHGAGTHVMGKDRTDSVVDQYQCVHGHANLFAIGCGSMPSIGTSNPTLTGAMAALRSADHIHSKLLAHNRPVSLAPRFGATTGNGANVPGQRVGDDAAADTAGLLTGKDR